MRRRRVPARALAEPLARRSRAAVRGRLSQRVTERPPAQGPARTAAQAGSGAGSSASSPGPRVVGRSPAEVSHARQGETIQIQEGAYKGKLTDHAAIFRSVSRFIRVGRSERPSPCSCASPRRRMFAGTGSVRRSDRPAGPDVSPWYRFTPIPAVLRSALTGSAPRLDVSSCRIGGGGGPSCDDAAAAGSACVASPLGPQRSNAGA